MQEEQLIRKIKGGIMGIKNNTKTPAEVGPLLNRLKAVNEGMYEELFNNYKTAVSGSVK
jgi:hypothetical protein